MDFNFLSTNIFEAAQELGGLSDLDDSLSASLISGAGDTLKGNSRLGPIEDIFDDFFINAVDNLDYYTHNNIPTPTIQNSDDFSSVSAPW